MSLNALVYKTESVTRKLLQPYIFLLGMRVSML